MFASSRQLAILEIVERDGGAELRQLADVFDVSPGTIRRDLMLLTKAGLVTRVHGGAVPRAHPPVDDWSDRPMQSAVALQRACRDGIAAEAAGLVADTVAGRPTGGAVALPAGPISQLLAQHLTTVARLTVVTYSVPVAQAFRARQRNDQTMVLTGGVFNDAHGLTGPMAAQAMQAIHIDVGFVEADGVDKAGRLGNTDAGTAELNRIVTAVADLVVCYADHTAWHRTARYPLAAPGPGRTFLLDPQVPAGVKDRLTISGARVLVAYGNERVARA